VGVTQQGVADGAADSVRFHGLMLPAFGTEAEVKCEDFKLDRFAGVRDVMGHGFSIARALF